MSPEEQAAADAIERYAQENALRAKQRLLAERTFDVLKRLRCDIPLGAHASYVGLIEKAERLRTNPRGANPFVDPAGYREYVARGERKFREQLAVEKRQ